jgi:hypothetical protein
VQIFLVQLCDFSTYYEIINHTHAIQASDPYYWLAVPTAARSRTSSWSVLLNFSFRVSIMSFLEDMAIAVRSVQLLRSYASVLCITVLSWCVLPFVYAYSCNSRVYVTQVKSSKNSVHTRLPRPQKGWGCLFVTSGPGPKAPGRTAAIRLIVRPVL